MSSFIATFSVGANCEFVHLVDFQISVKVYTQAIKQEGVHRQWKMTHINFAILNSSFIKNDNLAIAIWLRVEISIMPK